MASNLLLILALGIAIIAILVAIYAVVNSHRANLRARRAHSLFLMRQIFHLLEESSRNNHIHKSDISAKAKKLQVISEKGFNRTVRVVDEALVDKKVGLFSCPVLSSETLEWEVFSPKVNRYRKKILDIPAVPLQRYITSEEYRQGQELLAAMKELMQKDIEQERSLPT